jgi:hypothetical protein
VAAQEIFAIFGFDLVDVRVLEEPAPEPVRASDRFAARLRALLGSRYGLLLRWFVPPVLVAAVLVPLRRALREVVWQMRVRRDVQVLVDKLAPPDESVHSTVDVGAHGVTVRLLILGDSSRAQRVEEELRAGIAATTDVTATIDVVACPIWRFSPRSRQRIGWRLPKGRILGSCPTSMGHEASSASTSRVRGPKAPLGR